MALVSALALFGCSQSNQSYSLTTPDAANPNIFDWVDDNATPGRAGSGGVTRGNPDMHAEIYYGEGVQAAALDNHGNIVPASLSQGDYLRNNNSGILQAQGENGARPQGVVKTLGNGVNLNFENAEIKTVARAILGDVLGQNYSIDPQVSGTISLSTRRPVAREQLLVLLEDALRAVGAVVSKQSGVYRIVPDKDTAGVGQANVGRDAGEGGFGITALPLNDISADALMRILEGFGARPRAVRVDTERNLLIVQGTYSERQQLIDTALAFDVDWMRNQSVGIFPVQNSNPDVVINELMKMSDPNVVRFQPIERMNAILAISRSAQAIRQVSNWITRLDRISSAGVRVRVFRLKHADARRVAGLIRDVFGIQGSDNSLNAGDQIAPGSESTTTRVAAATTAGAGGVAQAGQAGETQTDATGDSLLSESAPMGGDSGSGRIRVTADLANNSIVVYANQEQAKMIERAISEMDRPSAQVAIEATIAEITLNDQLQNGIQFFLTSKNLGLGKNKGSIANLLDVLPLSRVVPGLNLLLGPEANPKLILDMLREISDVKVLSSPSLVVTENQPAILQVGDQVPVSTRSAQDVTNPTAPIVNSIEFRDTGVILRVTPRVHANSMVHIDVEQEISSVKDSGNTETLTPTISQRRVKSAISVQDGQTLLLAGLISEQRTKSKSGIPGVVDIPIVGNVLSRHRDDTLRTELIIFIKPQVIRNPIDARRVAEDLRRRMKGFERW